jgi:4'-phosphopantetheinyl transferase
MNKLNYVELLSPFAWQQCCSARVAFLNRSAWPVASATLGLLSEEERQAAAKLPQGDEQEHFILRRSFQRLFTATATGWLGSPADLPLVHERDRRPSCMTATDACLSFSSSGGVFTAGISRGTQLGIDVERLRELPDALEIAERFFHRNEVALLHRLPRSEVSSALIRLWSAKEACLKAVGLGMVHGPKEFVFSFNSRDLKLEFCGEHGPLERWQVESLAAPLGYVAFLAQMRAYPPQPYSCGQ